VDQIEGGRTFSFSLDLVIAEAKRRMRKRRVLVGIGVVLLASAMSVVLALRPSGGAGPAPFRGLSAVEHARTGASQLPLAVLEQIRRYNANAALAHTLSPRSDRPVRILPSTARIVGQTSRGFPIVVLADNYGEICLFGGLAGGCNPPPSRSNPIITGGGDTPSIGSPIYFGGVAIDGVISVSFRGWHRYVTVPVKHNIFIDAKPHSTASRIQCISAKFADGSIYRAPIQGNNCGNK